MSKDFKAAATGADRFFSANDTKDTQDTKGTQDIKDRFYRLNLKLDIDLKDYLSDEAWRQRTSITALVNKILKEYRDSHKEE
nr:MAG: hypothetical protein [Bacteriophage sp.]